MAKEEPKKQTKRPTAAKRDLQNVRRKLVNKAFKSKVHTAHNSFESALKNRDKETVDIALNNVFSMMDKGVKRGIFKPNKASRAKAQAAKKVARLAS